MTKKLSFNKTAKTGLLEEFNVNNYKIILIKDDSKTVSVNSYIFSGFIRETAKDLGINHLLEHVLVNAYKECKSYNCHSYLRQYGMDNNASTDKNILHYYVNGIASDWEIMLKYIANITSKPSFNEPLITREKSAVRNELHILKDSSTLPIYAEEYKLLYNSYGLRNRFNVQQQLDNLKTFKKHTLLKYFKKTYNYKNTIFVISGNISKSNIVTTLKSILPNTRVSNNSVDLNTDCFTFKPYFGGVYNPKLSSTQITLTYPVDIKYNEPAMFTLAFTISVLHEILYTELRTIRQLVYGLQMTLETSCCGSSIHIFINTVNENVSEVLTAYNNVIEDYNKYKLKSLEGIRKLYQHNYNTNLLNVNERGWFFGKQYIYKYILNSKVWSPHQILQMNISTTNSQIHQYILRYFDKDRLICLISNKKRLALSHLRLEAAGPAGTGMWSRKRKSGKRKSKSRKRKSTTT